MLHAGDTVRIKGQNVTEASMVVVRIDTDGYVATLRYWGGSAEFCEWTANLELIRCPHGIGDYPPADAYRAGEGYRGP